MKIRYFVFIVLLFFSRTLAGQEHSRILNFSDMHFDPFYDTTLISILTTSDYTDWKKIFEKSEIKAPSSYGSDSNFPLIISSLNEMKTRIPDPDFIIITGDFLGHNFNEDFEKYSGTDRKDSLDNFIEKTIRFVTLMITEYFPGEIIFPSLGNDDSYCGNYMVAPNSDFLRMTADVWYPLVEKCDLEGSFRRTFSEGGFCILNFPGDYSQRFIILNTIFFSSNYQNLCGDTLEDPGLNELEWLRNTLERCRQNDQKVWLSYHIPPGIDIFGTIYGKGTCEEKIFATWKKNYNEEFIRIMNEYYAVINTSFAGHFHRDDFRIFYIDNEPVSFIHLTPSISPVYGNNPAYQIIFYNKESYVLNNYETYYLKGLASPDSLVWTFEYDFRNAYSQNSISPAAMNNVKNLILLDSAYRVKYIEYYTSNNGKVFTGDYSNWFYNWCGFGNLTKEEYAKCRCMQ